MKRLDKLMAKSFVGPFVVTFAIAIFVLIMQVLWQYLDYIAGKGLGFFIVIELLSYKAVGLVPLALPLALLISSVMVLGGMAEHYELSSFKSAGVSLLRVIAPLVLFGVVGALVSFACADYLIPAANLQFGSRMYDIQQKKPTLSMEAGVFNEDFNQFAIRLGGRADDGRHISDVLMYDHTKASTGDLGQIVAKTGEMYTSPDGDNFVMKLNDGVQYSERRPTGKNRNSLPFVRTKFGTYTKLFNLSEFKLGVTSKSLFKTNRSMLATWQLGIAVDSIDTDIAIRKQTITNHVATYLPLLLRRDTVVHRERSQPVSKEENGQPDIAQDSAQQRGSLAQQVKDRSANGPTVFTADSNLTAELLASDVEPVVRPNPDADRDPKQTEAYRQARKHEVVTVLEEWPGTYAAVGSVSPTLQKQIFSQARSAARNITSQAKSATRLLPGIRESRVKHVYDLHMKYSLALVCIIFVFIGAPMGAIVRKGGFGYPILVSIIFFVLFIILTIFCRKLAESFVFTGAVAGWLPCIILFPISLWVTRAARNDTKLVDTDKLRKLWGGVNWFRRFAKA